MSNRAMEIMDFLAHAGWDGTEQQPLQADFSNRRFARLERDHGAVRHAVLMDADQGQKTDQFIAIAHILRECELSAPDIYAANAVQGLVLMEDFGDNNIGRMLDQGDEAKPLYKRAVDIIIHLHQRFDKAMLDHHKLPVFDRDLFVKQVELFLDAWFVFVKQRAATPEERDSFCAIWKQALTPLDQLPQSLMLRDFMPDNLMDLNRPEWRSIGLLDFQDGGMGPIAYDLASLCEVVRRDGGEALLDDMIEYYCDKAASKLSKQNLRQACRLLAAQRHTRILGIVANRALKTGADDKFAYVQRIWCYLDSLLQDEVLKSMRIWLDQHFPAAERSRVA